MKIKISALDKKFSKYIRWTRDRGECQRCRRIFTQPANNLHCSHFHGRRKQSVRFDPQNVLSLCFSCHQFFGENPAHHCDFMLDRLGKQQFDLLMLRANTPKRPDYKLIEMWLNLEEDRALNGE